MIDPIPWLPYLATDYIRQLKPQSVFEWGSGGSTLFFIELGVLDIVSTEHNQEWFEKVSEQIKGKQLGKNQRVENQIVYIEDGTIGSNPANPIHYKSASTELGEVNFRNYAKTIDHYNGFDLILIDGMARASCLYHAAKHVAEGGCIVLDNAERGYYMQNVEFLFEGWERVVFEGYGPILDYQWKTLFLINKRKSNYG